MPTSVLDRISKKLQAHPEEVEHALYELISEIRERVEYTGYSVVPDLGVFRLFKGNLVFEPAESLAVSVNFRFAGLEPVIINASPATRQSYRKRDIMSHTPALSKKEAEVGPVSPTEEGIPLVPPPVEVEPIRPVTPETRDEKLAGTAESNTVDERDLDQDALSMIPSSSPQKAEDIDAPAPQSFQEIDETDDREETEPGKPGNEPVAVTESVDAIQSTPHGSDPTEIVHEPETAVEPVHPSLETDSRIESRKEGKPSRLPVFLTAASVLIVASVLVFLIFPFSGTGENAASPVLSEESPASAENFEASQDPVTPPVDVQPEEVSPSEPVEHEQAESEPLSPLRGTEGINMSSGGYTIVVASRAQPGPAATYAQNYRDRGLRASVLHGPHLGVSRYRVVIGQFQTENEALNALQDESLGLPEDAWIMRIQTELDVVE